MGIFFPHWLCETQAKASVFNPKLNARYVFDNVFVCVEMEKAKYCEMRTNANLISI